MSILKKALGSDIVRAGLVIACAAAAALVLPQAARAQAFPSKPITIVVPYPPGGTTDALARLMQEPLQKQLGQVVLIENRPGASAVLGTKLVARAPADGYTLLFPNNGLVISPLVSKEASYAPLKDFVPVSLVSLQPMVLVINSAVPATTTQQFIDYAKARPGQIEYASAGPASFGQLSSELFARRSGIKLVHIPYKGQAPTTQAVLTGEVKMLLSTTSPQLNGFVKEGKLRMLGTGSPQASVLAPGAVPLNQTLPNFNLEVWFGLLAPAGTPRDVVTRLNDAIVKVLAQPEIKTSFEQAGALAASSTPEQFGARIAEEYANWTTVVKEAGIKPE
ncbi:tripartite tricarboxylate transporter substrate binding protein [Piscinibacter sakaiensis]|uniref:Putative exported protein n=1 Tax=Piscinibacter sakaiensis TaxID=1547922 RepID=A0A0K8P6R9_PISS1|nr:tripartite tricarboxylate transporter substrate binding protein [Piscinibacter sakaiensis]GAP37915.1 putative exported protein [Piscinibacter sakaiensis]